MNILVVDDSTAMRMIVIKTLREAGFDGHDIDQAADGAIAFEKIKESVPDLVLCDWNMPNMTGPELLTAIKAENINPPFGFITTEGTEEMRSKASELGARFLIAKPFTPDAFRAEIGKYIR
ncbi:MAG: response regulator [Gammaproteobacteria bacterium]|nr:MAG: response regulator [Gammaproteobacteria bacterium]